MTITPSKAEFLKLSGHGNLVPVYAEILADAETPVSAYQKLLKTGPSFLLESVEGGENNGRY
jgi:anthranilate synthase component 1